MPQCILNDPAEEITLSFVKGLDRYPVPFCVYPVVLPRSIPPEFLFWAHLDDEIFLFINISTVSTVSNHVAFQCDAVSTCVRNVYDGCEVDVVDQRVGNNASRFVQGADILTILCLYIGEPAKKADCHAQG